MSGMVKKRSINISKYFFLLLFLGFFGSITLFNHAHIADGIAIVHSHPFKCDKNGFPIHSHTTSGFLLIHILVNYTTIIIFALIAINISLNLLEKLSIIFYYHFLSQFYPICNPLRGPPADMLI
jgi:hypothetical protein